VRSSPGDGGPAAVDGDDDEIQQQEGDQIWWEKHLLTVDVSDRDLSGIVFRQLGFRVAIQGTHPAKLVRSANLFF
jgi:hypothetical protein